MIKIKHARTADCVVAGFRWQRTSRRGRIAAARALRRPGRLHHVGVTSSFTAGGAQADGDRLRAAARRRARRSPVARVGVSRRTGRQTRMPGGQSRWSAGKDLSWEPLRIERVCEVKYDHLQGDRFRHAAMFLRWRLDKPPADCRYDQLEVTTPYELAKVFGASGVRSLTPRRSRRRTRPDRAASCGGRRSTRHVLQVDADARPCREAPAHRVDQHVGRFQVRGGVRMPRPPSLQPRQRVFLRRGPPDLDQRMLRACADATAARAPARPAASGIAAATAHRPALPARAWPTAPAAVERAGVVVDAGVADRRRRQIAPASSRA